MELSYFCISKHSHKLQFSTFSKHKIEKLSLLFLFIFHFITQFINLFCSRKFLACTQCCPVTLATTFHYRLSFLTPPTKLLLMLCIFDCFVATRINHNNKCNHYSEILDPTVDTHQKKMVPILHILLILNSSELKDVIPVQATRCAMKF